MARSKVALDYRPALLSSSGIARAVRELARALAARPDVELHLFGHSLSPAARPDPVPAGARLHRLPIPGRGLPALARLGLDAARLAGRTALFHWTDYVHPPVGSASAVLTVHDLAFAENPAFHGAESDELLRRTAWAAERAARVITPTEATAAAARRHLGVEPERLRVVPFGVDHVPAAAGRSPDEPPFAVCLGTIEPRKNHLALLRAWRELPAPRPRLVVIGRPGWECAPIVAALEEAVRAGGVEWHRQLPDDRAFALLGRARALLYPSLLEGFGFPPLEAAALGVPVLAGDTPALRETLGDAAHFCDPREPRAIARALREVLADDDLRRRLIERGRRRTAPLTWARCAEAHAAIYRELTPV